MSKKKIIGSGTTVGRYLQICLPDGLVGKRKPKDADALSRGHDKHEHVWVRFKKIRKTNRKNSEHNDFIKHFMKHDEPHLKGPERFKAANMAWQEEKKKKT